MVCFQAVDALNCTFPSSNFVEKVFNSGRDERLRSIQVGHFLRSQCRHSDDRTALRAQAMVAGIIATVQERDSHWEALVKDQLGISEDVLQDYLAHGDSVLLANLIHYNRQCVRFGHVDDCIVWPLLVVQRTISQFDIRNTLPGLQHAFCAFWNEIARRAARESNFLSFYILKPFRHLYIALHQDTDAAPTAFDASTHDNDPIFEQVSSYPLCNIPSHHPQINNAAIAENTHPPTIPQPTVLPPHLVTNAMTPSTVSDGSPFSAPSTDHSCIHLPEKSLLHGVLPATQIIPSFHRSSFANVGKHGSAPSLGCAQAPTDAPTISATINPDSGPLPLMAESTSAPSSGDHLNPQYLGVFPSSLSRPSLGPVLSDTLPAEPESSSLASPAPQIDHVTPGPGLVSSTLATTISITAPQETSHSHPSMAQNDSTFNHNQNTQVLDISNTSETPEWSQPAPDIAAAASYHSLDTVPSSRGIDRPSSDENIG
jgi:hypothetical protein